MPGKTAKRGLHHLEIYVSNLKKSAAFWGFLLESLGYKEYQCWDKGRSWKLGQQYIVFVQTEKKYLKVPYHRKRTGLNHLAFHVPSKSLFSAIKKGVQRRGAKVLYRDKSIAPHLFYFEDPDRIKVELVLQR